MNKITEMKMLVEKLNEASNAYYNGTEESSMTDKQFDRAMYRLNALEQQTGVILSNSPAHNVGTAVVDSINKVKHNHLMLSLDKCHSVQELVDFAGDDDCYLSVKCDGLTCSLRYVNGELISAETRGDGYEGQSILFHATQFCNVPNTIPYTEEFVIDGEAVIFAEDFEDINKDLPEDKKFKNSRNLASGTLATLDANITKQRKVRFIAWRVIKGYDDIPSNLSKLKLAEKLGFTTPPMYEYRNDSEDGPSLKEMLFKLKQQATNMGLPMDGAVMAKDSCELADSMGRTDKFFYHSIAYKYTDETYETTLLDIDWTLGRTGAITPTAVFKPVMIDGTRVERASMHNLSVMNDLSPNGFYKGMKLHVYKANQIIPQIKSVEYNVEEFPQKEIEIPTQCPVCGGETAIKQTNESKVLICTNPDCPAKKLANFVHFVSRKCMNINGLNIAILATLIARGFIQNYCDIYHLSEHAKQLYTIDGMGRKSVNKLLRSIEKSRNTTLDRFITSLGIMGIGTSAAKTISKHFKTFDNWYINGVVQKFPYETLFDFGEAMSKSIYYYCTENAKLIADLAREMNFAEETEENVGTSLEGKTFCITGGLTHFINRDALIADIESRGGKFVSSVSSKCQYLINNDSKSASSKNKKAKELGVKIITEEQYLALLTN